LLTTRAIKQKDDSFKRAKNKMNHIYDVLWSHRSHF